MTNTSGCIKNYILKEVECDESMTVLSKIQVQIT